MWRDSKLLQCYYEIEISTALPWTLQEKKETRLQKDRSKRSWALLQTWRIGLTAFSSNDLASDAMPANLSEYMDNFICGKKRRKIRKKKI